MKCPFCGNRRFSVVSRVYQNIQFDERGKIVTSDTYDTDGIIEEYGYECLLCRKLIDSKKMIRNEFHVKIKNRNKDRKANP